MAVLPLWKTADFFVRSIIEEDLTDLEALIAANLIFYLTFDITYSCH